MYIDQLPNLPSADGTEKIPVSQTGADYAATIHDLMGSTFTLLNGETVSSGVKGTFSNRKFSDYNILFAEWVVSNSVRATGVIIRNRFTGVGNLSLFYVDSSNVQRYVEIAYTSDTSVTLSASNNASGSLYMFGI